VAASAACLIGVCLAISATALGASAIHFEPESLAALEGQLHSHQVHALSFHPAASTGHVHVSLNDGRHMTVVYTSAEQAQLIAVAKADGTRVAIARAKPKAAAKPAAHKLRYIAGGILIVVIAVVAAVLLIDRRRKLGQGGGDGSADGPAVPSSPGEST
jgi:hypothetical protein